MGEEEVGRAPLPLALGLSLSPRSARETGTAPRTARPMMQMLCVCFGCPIPGAG